MTLVEHTLHNEADAGQPFDRAETVHRSMYVGFLAGLFCDLRCEHLAKLAERRVSRLGLALFFAVFRREQTPACTVVSLHVGVGVTLTARATNRRRSSQAFNGRDDAGPRSQKHTGENMDTTTLIVIVLVVLLLGGGGFFYSRRV